MPEVLPRGRSGLPRGVVALSQRARAVKAMVEAVAEKGFLAVTVADITSRARISRTTFYEHFRDKEDCFLQAYEEGARLLYRDVLAAAERERGWFRRLQAGVRSYLENLDREPAYAKTFILEVLKVGPAALEKRAEVHARYAELLKASYAELRQELPLAGPLPESLFLSCVAAVNELVLERLRGGPPYRLGELEPEVLHVILSVFGFSAIGGVTLGWLASKGGSVGAGFSEGGWRA